MVPLALSPEWNTVILLVFHLWAFEILNIRVNRDNGKLCGREMEHEIGRTLDPYCNNPCTWTRKVDPYDRFLD